MAKIQLLVDSSELQTIIEALGRHAQRASLLSQSENTRAISELQRRIKSQAYEQTVGKSNEL